MKLRPGELTGRLKGPLPTVILIEGEETLLCIESQDKVRAAARAQGFTEREVYDTGPGFDPATLMQARSGLSLFSEKTLIELRHAKPKLDAKIEKALAFYLDGAPDDKCLVISAPKLDKGEKKKNWFKQLSSLGWHVECAKIYPEQYAGWLRSELKQAQIQVTDDGLSALLMRVEGNALAARQEIEKLKLFAGDSQWMRIRSAGSAQKAHVTACSSSPTLACAAT